MIKSGFLEAQSAKSLAQKKTTPFLRRLIASTIDRAAQEHYGAAYAMKCVQTSHAVVRLLDQFEIGGRLCEGGLCAAMVHEDSRFDGWGGFWDGNHHVWAMTRFGELVDLSISQMHRHSGTGRTDAIPVPALWWDDKNAALPVIRYLPDNFFMNVAFSDEAICCARSRIVRKQGSANSRREAGTPGRPSSRLRRTFRKYGRRQIAS